MKYRKCLYPFCKRGLLLVVILLFFFSACEKSILTEKPLDFIAPSNAYSTLNGISQGLTGLYEYVRDHWYGANDGDVFYLFAWNTDEAYYGENPGAANNYSLIINPLMGVVSKYWNVNYNQIQNANILIDGINASPDKIWANDAQRQSFLAEAMFFRAWAYRFLVSLYGDVPLITKPINYPKTDFVRAPKADVYNQIEQDLIYAAANLPEPGKEAAPGRLTQGAAWHMLSEIYLAESKFQPAVDAASHVINGYQYALMKNRFGTLLGHDVLGSGDVYFDLFGKENQNLIENTEAIWVIQVQELIPGGGFSCGERFFAPRIFSWGKTPDGFQAILGKMVNGAYTGMIDTIGRGIAACRPTDYVIYNIWRSDWNNDIRNAEHNIKRNYYFDNPASIYNHMKIDEKLYAPGVRNVIKDTTNYIHPTFMKVCSPCVHYTNLATVGGGYTHKDQYAIRLAETYLIRAEAYLGLGMKDLAASDINVIRNRAKANPVAPANVNIDFILDERARELYTEEFRLLTLTRTGKLVERVRKYNNNPYGPGLNIQDFNNLWPIPQAEIDLNINAVLTQNPGY